MQHLFLVDIPTINKTWNSQHYSMYKIFFSFFPITTFFGRTAFLQGCVYERCLRSRNEMRAYCLSVYNKSACCISKLAHFALTLPRSCSFWRVHHLCIINLTQAWTASRCLAHQPSCRVLRYD